MCLLVAGKRKSPGTLVGDGDGPRFWVLDPLGDAESSGTSQNTPERLREAVLLGFGQKSLLERYVQARLFRPDTDSPCLFSSLDPLPRLFVSWLASPSTPSSRQPPLPRSRLSPDVSDHPAPSSSADEHHEGAQDEGGVVGFNEGGETLDQSGGSAAADREFQSIHESDDVSGLGVPFRREGNSRPPAETPPISTRSATPLRRLAPPPPPTESHTQTRSPFRSRESGPNAVVRHEALWLYQERLLQLEAENLHISSERERLRDRLTETERLLCASGGRHRMSTSGMNGTDRLQVVGGGGALSDDSGREEGVSARRRAGGALLASDPQWEGPDQEAEKDRLRTQHAVCGRTWRLADVCTLM
uniref:Uncharacterized protein n=1 Tax=Chromera velia CCMP2878 TaxID=1169474 RepID=A0A0G4HGC0_9ALVE|eukprot:Cvel_27344.t1-p1 / transcript=Cvel_27344.t1 / gene=Cvel_27344 / organism=Chromera_velia_CCMP2878 / gene_product=hypothetical protein / transcript_product=hypothetical protein / location=Cvel_scaffold3395:15784-16860(-) / protein_length=359 / sequence_SO=supercontig / SO=protein_coding / is_pseudo=false